MEKNCQVRVLLVILCSTFSLNIALSKMGAFRSQHYTGQYTFYFAHSSYKITLIQVSGDVLWNVP